MLCRQELLQRSYLFAAPAAQPAPWAVCGPALGSSALGSLLLQQQQLQVWLLLLLQPLHHCCWQVQAGRPWSCRLPSAGPHHHKQASGTAALLLTWHPSQSQTAHPST